VWRDHSQRALSSPPPSPRSRQPVCVCVSLSVALSPMGRGRSPRQLPVSHKAALRRPGGRGGGGLENRLFSRSLLGPVDCGGGAATVSCCIIRGGGGWGEVLRKRVVFVQICFRRRTFQVRRRNDSGTGRVGSPKVEAMFDSSTDEGRGF
jgi:hypothetical protein